MVVSWPLSAVVFSGVDWNGIVVVGKAVDETKLWVVSSVWGRVTVGISDTPVVEELAFSVGNSVTSVFVVIAVSVAVVASVVKSLVEETPELESGVERNVVLLCQVEEEY